MFPFAVEALAEGVCALARDPARAAVLCDVDGTLGPVVDRADDAQAPGVVSRLLGALGRRYACVARVSGSPRLTAALGRWRGPVRRFAAARDTREPRVLRVRIGDKGPIAASAGVACPEMMRRWAICGASRRRRGSCPVRAQGAGGAVAGADRKGQSVRDLVGASLPHAALFGGSDVTDLDASGVLDALVADGRPGSAVGVGVRSEEGPGGMVMRTDGAEGFARVLEGLLRAAR